MEQEEEEEAEPQAVAMLAKPPVIMVSGIQHAKQPFTHPCSPPFSLPDISHVSCLVHLAVEQALGEIAVS